MVVPREARLPGAREAVLRRALAPRRIWLTSHTMVTDVVVLIADAVRLRAIREALPFPGRILYFNDSNLATALGTIRANEPCRIALDIQFAHSSTGRAFTGKLQSLATKGSEVLFVSLENGRWSMHPIEISSEAVAAAPETVVASASAAVVAASSAAVVATASGAVVSAADLNLNLNPNTRRVPRFPVVDPLAALVDGKTTSLIDMSLMGAQVVSAPVLKPNQRLRITLPDEGDTVLQVTAHIAWSEFQTSKNTPLPFYRAGLEFTDASAQALEEYLKRHCSDAPIPPHR